MSVSVALGLGIAGVSLIVGLGLLRRIAQATADIGAEIWELQRRELVAETQALYWSCAAAFIVCVVAMSGALLAESRNTHVAQASEADAIQHTAALEKQIATMAVDAEAVAEAAEQTAEKLSQANQRSERALARYRQLKSTLSFEVRRGRGTALVRSSPTGEVVEAIPRGSRVKLRPIKPLQSAGRQWLAVSTASGTDGWMASELVIVSDEVVDLLARS